MIPLGSILRKLRNEQNLSQKQLAQRIGIDSSTIALYETGDRNPSLPVLIKLSRTLGVTTDYLLGVSDKKDTFIDASGLTPCEISSINIIIENYRKNKK